jgi:curved DNA-binding protein CbpA
MNHYEELGIRQDAALEEIRQAYKVLARLLHPDAQPDARLKAMAECQMKRLNEILAILTDSQKRRQYDESLRESPKAALEWVPPPVPKAYWYYQVLHFGLRHWFWILIGLAVAGVGLWCIEQGTPEAAQVAPKHNEALPDAPCAGAPGAAEPRAAGPDATAPPPRSLGYTIKPAPSRAASAPLLEAPHAILRQAAVGNAAAAEANPPEPVRSSPAKEPLAPNPIAIAEPPRVAVEAPKVEPPRAASRASEVSFAGNWFYAPETGSKPDPNLYPATYVEFILADENGSLVGNYRAKYRIPDQAISPEVQFRVQGKSANGKSCKLTWTSDDGAQGEAELTLRSSNQMNVTWWTTVFGRRAALSSGMAVLIRQQAP